MMVRIVVDSDLRQRLGGLDDQLEIFDEHGRVLGRFLPVRESKLAHIEAQCPYTRGELDAMKAETGGRSLAEIWKDLGQK